jgi:hypothetical protein
MKKLLSLFLGFTILTAPFSAQAADGKKALRYGAHIAGITFGALLAILSIKDGYNQHQETIQATSLDWNTFLSKIEKKFGTRVRKNYEDQGKSATIKNLSQQRPFVYLIDGLFASAGALLIAYSAYKIHQLRTK